MDTRYWTRAATAFARHARTPGFVREVARAGLVRDGALALRSMSFLDCFPEADGLGVDMGVISYRRSNLDPMERYVLAALCRLRRPRRILEIGTYDGATTLLLARNAPDAEVLTIDLAPEQAGIGSVAAESHNAAGGVGMRFRGTPEAQRIIQLLGDSTTFDFSPWSGTVDLVLVDGGHDYACAKSDSVNALHLVTSSGVILWDDYQLGWPGVVRAVEEVCAAGSARVVHLANTDLALWDNQDGCAPGSGK